MVPIFSQSSPPLRICALLNPFKESEELGFQPFAQLNWLLAHAPTSIDSICLLSALPPDYELLTELERGEASPKVLTKTLDEELSEARAIYGEEPLHRAQQEIEKARDLLLAAANASDRDIQISSRIVKGTGGGASGVGASILQAVQQKAAERSIDLVLCGSRALGSVGRDLVQSMGLGSVSDYLAQTSPVPVLIVPTRSSGGSGVSSLGGSPKTTTSGPILLPQAAPPSGPSGSSSQRTVQGSPAQPPLRHPSPRMGEGVAVLLDGSPQSLEALQFGARLYQAFRQPSQETQRQEAQEAKKESKEPFLILRCRLRPEEGVRPTETRGIGTGIGEAAGVQGPPQRTEEGEGEEEDDPVGDAAAQTVVDEAGISEEAVEVVSLDCGDVEVPLEDAYARTIQQCLRARGSMGYPFPSVVVMGARGCGDLGKGQGGNQAKAGMEGLGPVAAKLLHSLLNQLGVPVAVVRKAV